MLSSKQKKRFVNAIRKGLHGESLCCWLDTTDLGQYDNIEYFMLRIGNWYVLRTDHGMFCGEHELVFIEGSKNAIDALKSAKGEGFDDVMSWYGDPEDVLKLPDVTTDFGGEYTPKQIVEIIEADEHLFLYARDPEYDELPDEYYPQEDEKSA